jgi:hypothetical protein
MQEIRLQAAAVRLIGTNFLNHKMQDFHCINPYLYEYSVVE